MDQVETQAKLKALYNDWKQEVQGAKLDFSDLGPPQLLFATEEYCQAARRVIVFGQEPNGWSWQKGLKATFPDYPDDWRFADLVTMQDFLSSDDAIEGLCWGYHAFNFGKSQPKTKSKPFWWAFNEIRSWPDTGVLWSNVARCDSMIPKKKSERSIFNVSNPTRTKIFELQRTLFAGELAILKPDVCVFLSGNGYDICITTTFEKAEFLACSEAPVLELALVRHKALPAASYRTYHPGYLNRDQKRWTYIEKIRKLAMDENT